MVIIIIIMIKMINKEKYFGSEDTCVAASRYDGLGGKRTVSELSKELESINLSQQDDNSSK